MMSLRWRNTTYFLLIAAFIFSAGCSRQPEEEVLRGIVKEVADAAERKDVKAIRKHISKSYKDFEGNDYDGIKRLLLYHFLRAEKITIFVRGVDVKVKKNEAVVDARVVLVRGKEIKTIKDVIPEEAAAYHFNVVFRKEKKRWKTINARWENVGIRGLLS